MRSLREVMICADLTRIILLRRLEDRRTPPAVWNDKSLTGEGEEGCSTESPSTTPG